MKQIKKQNENRKHARNNVFISHFIHPRFRIVINSPTLGSHLSHFILMLWLLFFFLFIKKRMKHKWNQKVQFSQFSYATSNMMRTRKDSVVKNRGIRCDVLMPHLRSGADSRRIHRNSLRLSSQSSSHEEERKMKIPEHNNSTQDKKWKHLIIAREIFIFGKRTSRRNFQVFYLIFCCASFFSSFRTTIWRWKKFAKILKAECIIIILSWDFYVISSFYDAQFFATLENKFFMKNQRRPLTVSDQATGEKLLSCK